MKCSLKSVKIIFEKLSRQAQNGPFKCEELELQINAYIDVTKKEAQKYVTHNLQYGSKGHKSFKARHIKFVHKHDTIG